MNEQMTTIRDAEGGDCQIRGPVVVVHRGEWCNDAQDWKAVLTLASGVVVRSGLWFRRDSAFIASIGSQSVTPR